jgi:hypothetical protein
MATELILFETVDPVRVSQLLQNPNVENESKVLLKKYQKNFIKKERGYKVVYEQKLGGYGRRFCLKGLGLQYFSKKIRHTLVADTHIDLDIVNCHLILMEQYCEKNGIMCSSVTDYVAHREERMEELIELYDSNRDTIKDMILVMMYGGHMTSVMAENGFDITIQTPEWLETLNKEFVRLLSTISKLNPDISELVKKKKDKSHGTNEASTVSYVLGDIEDRLIINARNKLKEMGYKVDALCFDGLLVQNQPVFDKFREIEIYCEEQTGYKVSWIEKPMVPFYVVDDDEEPDYSDYDFQHTDFYNQKYVMSLTEETPLRTYTLRRTYIEMFLCKIQAPSPIAIFQNGTDKKVNYMSTSDIAILLKPIMSGYMNQLGAPICFYDKWSLDVNHRVFRKMDFIPHSVDETLDEVNVFNLFEGFPEFEGKKSINPYLDLVQEMCGGNDEHAMFYHKLCANILRNPRHRTRLCVIFKGKQGCGKGVIMNVLGDLVGKAHFISSANPKDFFDTHAEGFVNKLVVCLNEAEGKGTFDFEGQIKSVITDDTIGVNPKNVKPYSVRNYVNMFVTTNKRTPMKIDFKTKDRRFVVFQATDKYLTYNAAAWTKLIKHFESEGFLSSLHDWYMSMDLNVDWIKQRPITQAYKEMMISMSPIEASFFEWFVDEEKFNDFSDNVYTKDDFINIKTSELFSMYERYCKENRFLKDDNKAVNSKSFLANLVELEIPLKRVKSEGHNKLHLCPNRIMDFLCVKKWVSSSIINEDEEIAEYAEKGEDFPTDYFD